MIPLEFKMEGKSTLVVGYKREDCYLTYHTRHNGKHAIQYDSLEEAVIDSTMWITTGDLIERMNEVTAEVKIWLLEEGAEDDEYGAPQEPDYSGIIEARQDAYDQLSEHEVGNIA